MASSDPSSSSSTILPLLTSLPLSSSALIYLLEAHKPFARPSLLPGSAGTKFVSRLNSTILARDAVLEEKHACLRIAKELVEEDQEGWVLATSGKGWVGTTLGVLSASNTSLATVKPNLDLLQTLILASPSSPSFEREAIHPIMGKVSTTLLKLAEKGVGQIVGNEDVLLYILSAIRDILIHSPAAFRPTVNALRTLILPLIISQQTLPSELRDAAISLLTSLYLCQGKAAVAQGWRAEMGDAIAGIAVSLDAVVADGWIGDNRPSAAFPPGLTQFPVDAPSRLPLALYALDGYAEIALALLRQSTSRPVPVPLAYIGRLGIRCLDLSLDTPTVPYISPQYHGNLIASLPRIWTVGMLLLGSTASTCGDHLLVHLTEIVDTTLHLAETTPSSYMQSQTQLLRLHNLLLEKYPSAVWHPDHPTRLLKLCLSKLSTLLDPPPKSSGDTTMNGHGNKGKKRARGEEDGLIASLEGRDSRKIGREGLVALEALQLIPKLQIAPSIPPSLLTLSIRLHLSLYLVLPNLSPRRFEETATQQRLIQAVKYVLESACLMVEEGGHSRGWKSVILGVLGPTQGRLSTLLHPQLPALPRPPPPLSALHFFTAETEQEAKYRQELGLHTTAPSANGDEEDMEVESEVVETVVVPVAPDDVRAGKMDVADTTLPPPIPGHMKLQDPDIPQPGHYPPVLAPTFSPKPTPVAAHIPATSPVLSVAEKATSALEQSSTAESVELQRDFISFGQAGQGVAGKSASGVADMGGMEVDEDGSDVGIPDLDSENSGFEDDDDEEEDEE